jgi:hypothetical protein
VTVTVTRIVTVISDLDRYHAQTGLAYVRQPSFFFCRSSGQTSAFGGSVLTASLPTAGACQADSTMNFGRLRESRTSPASLPGVLTGSVAPSCQPDRGEEPGPHNPLADT